MGVLCSSATDNAYNQLGINFGKVVITNPGAALATIRSDRRRRWRRQFRHVGIHRATDTITNRITIGEQSTPANSDPGDTGSGTILSNGTGAVTFSNTLFNTVNNDTMAARTITFGGANTDANTVVGVIRDHTNQANLGVEKDDDWHLGLQR